MPKGIYDRTKSVWNKDKLSGVFKSCIVCKKVFYVIPCRKFTAKYCSKSCAATKIKTHFKKGLIEERSPAWKGDQVGYHGLHKWVYKNLGKPRLCFLCYKSVKQLHWANKTGKYFRNLEDWLSLCVSCHKKYDLERNKIYAL